MDLLRTIIKVTIPSLAAISFSHCSRVRLLSPRNDASICFNDIDIRSHIS